MPLSELYNAVDPQGTILNARVFGGAYPGEDPFQNSRGQFPDAYKFAKTFVSPAYAAQGSGNGVTSIDDPTYLGFSLRFDINSPLFNGSTSATKPAPQFNPVLNLTAETPDGAELVGPRPNPSPSRPAGESALGYLETIGETTRANYLRAFIQGIREINTTRPYYWQTIEGLSDAWNKTFLMTDPYSGSAEGEGITIGCLEALDLKISALFNLYKAAVYDTKYKRTILPINLMYFNVYVDVHEIRKFKSIKNWLTKGNTNDNENDTLKLINENTATITFIFEECIWDLTATGKVFDNVTNAGGNEMTVSEMKWTYSKVEMESQFPGYGSALSDRANLQPLTLGGRTSLTSRDVAKKIFDNAVDSIQRLGPKTVNNLKKGVVNKVERTARSLIQGPLLGNVFGQRNQILSSISNPQALINAVGGAAFQNAGLPQSSVSSSIGSLGDGVFAGQIPNIQSSLSSSNVFGPRPSGPPPLESNNVFGE